MINLEELKKIIETGLNNVPDSKYLFNLFSEKGDYIPAQRDGNKVEQIINGIMSVLSSDIIPTNGINVSTLVTQLEFIVPINDEYTDQQEEIFSDVRNVIVSYFEATNTTTLTDSNNISYSVATYADLPTTGEVEIRNGIGESINYTVTVYFSFVENGESSMDYEFYLKSDDMTEAIQLPYTSANINRTNSSESGVYGTVSDIADNYVIQNTPVSSAFSVNMSVPLLCNNYAVQLVKKALIEGIVKPLTLTVKYLKINEKFTYTVFISETSLSLQGVQNGGLQVSFIEKKTIGV